MRWAPVPPSHGLVPPVRVANIRRLHPLLPFLPLPGLDFAFSPFFTLSQTRKLTSPKWLTPSCALAPWVSLGTSWVVFEFESTSGSTVSQHVLVSLGSSLVQVLRLLSTPQYAPGFHVPLALPVGLLGYLWVWVQYRSRVPGSLFVPLSVFPPPATRPWVNTPVQLTVLN